MFLCSHSLWLYNQSLIECCVLMTQNTSPAVLCLKTHHWSVKLAYINICDEMLLPLLWIRGLHPLCSLLHGFGKHLWVCDTQILPVMRGQGSQHSSLLSWAEFTFHCGISSRSSFFQLLCFLAAMWSLGFFTDMAPSVPHPVVWHTVTKPSAPACCSRNMLWHMPYWKITNGAQSIQECTRNYQNDSKHLKSYFWVSPLTDRGSPVSWALRGNMERQESSRMLF